MSDLFRIFKRSVLQKPNSKPVKDTQNYLDFESIYGWDNKDCSNKDVLLRRLHLARIWTELGDLVPRDILFLYGFSGKHINKAASNKRVVEARLAYIKLFYEELELIKAEEILKK